MDYNATAKSAIDPTHRIGKITKLYGENGGIVLKLNTELSAKEFLQIYNKEPLWIQIDSIATPFFCATAKAQGSAAVAITLDYVGTDQIAQMLVGKELFLRSVVRERQRANDWDDLAGLTFTDQTSGKSGTITEVIENSLNPLLLVEIDAEEHYVPLAEDLIVGIDQQNVLYELPENFFEN